MRDIKLQMELKGLSKLREICVSMREREMTHKCVCLMHNARDMRGLYDVIFQTHVHNDLSTVIWFESSYHQPIRIQCQTIPNRSPWLMLKSGMFQTQLSGVVWNVVC